MAATVPGHNRTGSGLNPGDTRLMLAAVRELSPPRPISTRQSEMERGSYISEADSIGSIPPPVSLNAKAEEEMGARLNGVSPEVFLDKLGERIAFERGGTRLYDALIAKYVALAGNDGDILPPFEAVAGENGSSAQESALETLHRIRSEELDHFRMLSDAATLLGADPTAQTPSADVIATASMGLLQAITDPRTTLAQSLNALLTAELTDNVGWELLVELAGLAGQDTLVEQFSRARAEEAEHQIIITGWVKSLVTDAAGTEAV